MTPERWQKVEAVLQTALDLPEKERLALVAETCSGDPDLQNEAAALIDAHEEAGDFLEHSALEQDAHVLLDHDQQDHIAREIGPYKVMGRLGGGGMGEVYLARDQRLGRLVALKILPPWFIYDDERLRRFQTEARSASALNHANILTIYEFGQSEGIHFIAAEYIEGQTIRELIQSENLSLGEVLDIVIQLVTGLSAAHAAGIIHRDVKPENIMRRDDGTIKTLDFGIAKLIEGPASNVSNLTSSSAQSQTQTGVVLGTIGYISPEQVRGLAVDERSDIWSSGVVLYEMLAGHRPFPGVTNADTIVSILERDPAPLFPSEAKDPALRSIQQIVDKALRKNASKRFQTASEMLEDLVAAKKHLDLRINKRRPAIGAQTRVEEIQALTAGYSSARRSHSFLIPTILVSLVLLFIAGFLYRQFGLGKQDTSTPPARKIYTQMTEAERLDFVNEQEQRISAMMGDRRVRLNDEAVLAIKGHVDRYVARSSGVTESGVESLATVYGRAAPYVPVIARAFAARRIPVVVGIYLAMLESEFRPCTESSLGAKGLFQFLPGTAQHYGVASSDMCDVNKMAPAAAHYIADRMAELGDDSQSMTLVLLSYNRGAESVRESLRLLRETDRNYERNYWSLFANRDRLDETFRRESAYYVPGFFAVAIIGENPEVFELETRPLSSLANKDVLDKL